MSRFSGGRRLRRPSPGLVVGSLALVAALGGTASALPGSGSVDANDLGRNVVSSANIRTNAVAASDIRAGAVQASELGNVVVRDASAQVADGTTGGVEAACAPGERMIGGGGATTQAAPDAIFAGSFPTAGGGTPAVNGGAAAAWAARATNTVGGALNIEVKAWAVCLQ